MQLSNDTLAVVNYLDEYTGGNLRKKNDIGAVIEICATYNEPELLNRIIFTGKSLWNIASKLRKVNPSADGIELLQKEVERCSTELSGYLSEIAGAADDDLKKRFDDIYLQLTRGAVKNLIDLGHDLAKFKDLQTILRQKSKE